MEANVYNPSYTGDIGRKITAKGRPEQKAQHPSSKAKRAGGVAYMVECLQNKALSSNPITSKQQQEIILD